MKPKIEDAAGPWPFITRRVYRRADGALASWSSRHHRKGLVSPEAARVLSMAETLLRCLWMPRTLNWWIGTVFAVGSLLFAVGSLLSLWPQLAAAWSLNSTAVNAIFFAGSIPFTTAAYLQLFQAANANTFSEVANAEQGSDTEKGSDANWAKHPKGRSGNWLLTPFRLGWRPHDVGWLSCALQFVGTILFNFNTFDAMIPALNWFQQDLVIWVPDTVGSVLFLVSGYLAFIETCHAHWAWKPTSISWWVVFTNLLGCVGFMISAVFAIYLPGPPDLEAVAVSVLFTLLGAIGFLAGSLLMLPEAA